MTATEVLRRLLDERGVEWDEYGDGYTLLRHGGREYTVQPNVCNRLIVTNLTPEQAIAATLGAGTCHVESSIIDTYEYNRWEYELSCGHTIIWEDSEPPNYCPICGRRIEQ